MPGNSATTRVVRSLRGGQITIPAVFRRELGIGDDTLLRLTLDDGELRLRPVEFRESKDSVLQALYQHFAPVREEILLRGISEAELNADIDAAVRGVRRQPET